MSNYFSEHDCEPLDFGQTPNHFLHMARLLLDSGMERDNWLYHFQLVTRDRKPPASHQFIETLPKHNQFKADENCSVCLKRFTENQTLILTCGHYFHSDCIKPWLQITNSCPLCRTEFPTDDREYETYKREKQRKESLLNEIHNSMFG